MLSWTKFFTHNAFLKLVSIVIAVLLWVVILGSRKTEVTKEVPLEVVTAEGVVVANPYPDRIRFQLSGPQAFLRAILDRRDPPIRVNLTRSKIGPVNYRFFSDNIKLPIGISVQSIKPNSLLFRLEKEVTKEVPVRITIRGTPPEGYQVIKKSTSPTRVKLRGPRSKISKLGYIYAHPIDVSDAKRTLSAPASFDTRQHGVDLVGEPPEIKVQIKPVSANFRIRNVKIRVLSDFRARLSEKSVTVFVRADTEDLENLDQSKVFAEIDLRGQKKGKYTKVIDVKVPENIGLVKVMPEKVKVTLY